LHDVLKSSPEDLARNLNGIADDPFFSEEDYALMDPGIPVDDEDDSESSEEMEAMYDAMDAELKATAASRAKEVGAQEEIADENVAVDAHVLSNLMQSLGASEGAPGPVENMLKEMGIHPPKLRSDDMDGDEVER
jgi:phosphosulfolactate synthase (CoM biosynthesis protein A)